MSPKLVLLELTLLAAALLGLTGSDSTSFATVPDSPTRLTGCEIPQPVTPALRQEILAEREAVWRAWFANDQKTLETVIPEEIVAINPGVLPWQDRAAVLADARSFAAKGGRLLRLEYPSTEIRLYGNVAILYTTYLYEYELTVEGLREEVSGRGTEIFIRRGGRWVNAGWHLDSGK